MGEMIRRNIVEDCNTAGHFFFFSIYAGDVLDVGNHEFAVIARFVNKENQIKDEFLTFIVNQC